MLTEEGRREMVMYIDGASASHCGRGSYTDDDTGVLMNKRSGKV